VPQDNPTFGIVDGPFGKLDLGLRPKGMSNALLVDAKHSATGHPTVVFGPQTGYFTPQLLTEISLRGPGIAARGVSFAGTQLIVELGHGVDYAWSATSASGDLVDTVAERLCEVDGSPATVESTAYLVGTTCTPFDEYVHTETALPSAAGMALPTVVRLRVQRTRHGIVQERTTVDGKPVALVLQRSTYGQELDSAVGFARVNDPEFTKDAASFARAFDGVDYTFNWFYVDDRDISYFKSGLLPVRAPASPTTCRASATRSTTGAASCPFRRKPQQINPPQGYLTSWNNKQARLLAADNQWGYGPVYRSQLLDRRILQRSVRPADQPHRPRSTRCRTRATQTCAASSCCRCCSRPSATTLRRPRPWPCCARGCATTPPGRPGPRRCVRRPGRDRAVRRVVGGQRRLVGRQGGAARHARRADRPAAAEDRRPPAPRTGLGLERRRLVRLRAQGPAPGARAGGDAAVLPHLLRGGRAGHLPHAAARVAGRGHAAGARRAGGTEVSALTYDKSEDFIRSVTAGLVGVRPIDWQNRPTFQQWSFSTHRPRASAPLPSRPPRAPVAGGQLPATGLEVPALVAVLALGLVLVGLLRLRRAH
jgi:hypothetical protein